MNAQDRVSLTLPARAEYLLVARLTASAVLERMGFTLDQIEDGKVAVAESCIWLMGCYRPRELRLSFTPGADLFVRVDMFGVNEGPGIEEPCEHSLLLVEAMSKTAQVLEEDGAVVGLQLALAGEA